MHGPVFSEGLRPCRVHAAIAAHADQFDRPRDHWRGRIAGGDVVLRDLECVDVERCAVRICGSPAVGNFGL